MASEMTPSQRAEIVKLEKKVASLEKQVGELEVERSQWSKDDAYNQNAVLSVAVASVCFEKKALEEIRDNVELSCNMQLRQMNSSHRRISNDVGRQIDNEVDMMEVQRGAILAGYNPSYNMVEFNPCKEAGKLFDVVGKIENRKKELNGEDEAAARIFDEAQTVAPLSRVGLPEKLDNLMKDIELARWIQDFLD